MKPNTTPSATMILHSVSPAGAEITTLQLRLHKYILAELNTHRSASKSTSSSRAIPSKTLLQQVRTSPATPPRFQRNQSGMQGAEEEVEGGLEWWQVAAKMAADVAEEGAALGLHKQVANRVIDPFVMCSTVITETNWSNFLNQRLSNKADPAMEALAIAIAAALKGSAPVEREKHLPYVLDSEIESLSLAECLCTSVARCCRVSYDRAGHTFSLRENKARALQLYEDRHWGPFEHQAFAGLDTGFWSGNLKGWVQHRQMIQDNKVRREAENWSEAMHPLAFYDYRHSWASQMLEGL